ncbi:amino acid permease [Oscillatoria sp. FACHB-1407]|uniref:ATP-binding protein n=1 Tax=Oscillatoria sp. FACHB-1407 TaxID=2692847 RepID=UPI0016869C02|nr:ATP-binding protein [Oscillatoria sp. FACHB-1407]MBD2465879.1 amino acid permease [Oscillatoria sp. FACHB-1407]
MLQSLNTGSSEPGLSNSSPTQLPRNLSLVETWGFGLTGLLLWMGVAPGTQAELGSQAMWVWIPGAIIGVLINLQVRALGRRFPDVAGGTPNYVTHLLKDYPKLTSYAAIGYFISWVAVLPINAIILSDLITAILEPLGIGLPEIVLRIGFTVLAFIVAFSGSHALGTLHLVFLLPAVGFLLTFCLQGSHAAIASSTTFSLLPDSGSTFSFQGWAKWYLSGTYAFYACETASVFVADSKRPIGTLQSLLVAAGLIPIVYVGGSWVLLHLAPEPDLGNNTFLSLLAAAKSFWGQSASSLVTFLVVSNSLLSCATAVAICPRILYQLSRDHHLSPIFGVTSRQGVFAPGLLLTLILSLVWLVWDDVHQIVMITGVSWFVCFIVLHWGLWQQRHHVNVFFPWLSLGLCVVECLVLIVGGLAWGLPNLLVGLLLPIALMIIDRLIRKIPYPLQLPQWFNPLQRDRQQKTLRGFIALQVFVLILFICGATILSWSGSTLVDRSAATLSADPLVVLILVLSFIGVAIACWTIFPQIVAVNEARQRAEQLSGNLQQTLQELQRTQLKMVQQEKMSGLGQLVAGVAHEINNPVSFIHGNVAYAQSYVEGLLKFIELYQKHYPDPNVEIKTEAEKIDLEFLQKDLPKLLNSMQVGTERILDIVLSLRTFSRTDEADVKAVDIHSGINSTLMILQHRLKANTQRPEIIVVKNYDSLPMVECYPGQLNQVFMNILSNAIDALDEANATRSYQEITANPNCITIRTSVVASDWIQVAIADNGPGIPDAIKNRIFDPFFTTKSVGKGTGMGLSISYQIIVEKHGGKLECFSNPNQGTEFVIELPIQQQGAKSV